MKTMCACYSTIDNFHYYFVFYGETTYCDETVSAFSADFLSVDQSGLLFQIDSLGMNKLVTQPINCGLALLEDDMTDQWLILAIIRLHVQEGDFAPKTGSKLSI